MEPETPEERVLQMAREVTEIMRQHGIQIDHDALEAARRELEPKWKEPPPAPKSALERVCGDVLGEE